jgi:hypothetical protein
MQIGNFMLLLQRCTKAVGECSRDHFLCWTRMMPQGGILKSQAFCSRGRLKAAASHVCGHQ